MNPIEYKITLDCRRAESQVTITAKQGEASGRKITFSLNEGRLPYKVPSGVTAVLRAKKPSGAVLYNTCTVTPDGNVEYTITTQTVAEVGKLPCELQLSQDGKVIFSPNFTLLVYKNLSVDSEVESSDEFTALQAAISRAESLTDGTTFTPSVSEDGVLSWTNDGGKPNPEPVNIKGEDGAFRVNVTYSNGVYTADKTFTEIKAAYDAGKQPYVVLTGGTLDLVYTLASFSVPDGTGHDFVDFKRYLIWEDTLETETLRIYSYTTDSGSNIENRISEFNAPGGSVVIEGTVSGDMSEVTITTPDAWTLVSEAWNSEKRPLVVLRLSDELYAYLTSVSTLTIDGQSQGMALFSLPPSRHLNSAPPYSIWLDESGGASILPVEGINGTDGKSAYQYAVEGGYTGTEAEFSTKMAALHSHDNKAVLDGITAEKVSEWDSALHSDDLYTATLYPNFVNQLPISKDEQGDVYNGVGYNTYQQLNSDGTVTPTGAANVVSGYIPVKNGSIIRLDGFELPNAAGGRMVVTYDAEYNKVQHSIAGSIPNNYYFRDNVEYSDADQTKIKQFSISHQSNVAYLRICTFIDHMSANPIVTVDEEITYSETGKKFLPTVRLDYSQIDNVPETDTKAYTPILPTEHLSIAYSSIGRKPINTIEHFIDCAENYGYNGLKCDVRPTSDGELICCHDAGFSFDGNGKITTYNASDATMIHDVTAATCIGYEFATGEHPCLVGDYLAVCRKYGKVAFVTIRNEYMDVVIPKLISEINLHHMQGATIINSMTYASLVRWREIDEHIALNYTLERGANITPTEIDKAVALGNCSMSGFGFGGSNAQSDITCDFAYAASKGVRLTNAICQVEGSYENAIAEGYDGAHIGYPWGQSVKDGTTLTLTPTQVYDAVSAGIPVKVQYFDGTYGSLSFTIFNAKSSNVVVSQRIISANGEYILAELIGNKPNGTWDFRTTTLQTSSITDKGGHFTSDTVEGALQEVGAELAGINTLLGSGIQISFTIDDGGSSSETFSVVSGTTWAEWIGTGRPIFNNGLVLYIYGGVVATEAGVYAVSLDGSTAVSGSDEIVSGATYTIINWGG